MDRGIRECRKMRLKVKCPRRDEIWGLILKLLPAVLRFSFRGQRAAWRFAGVIAMDPDYLILDEPSAGLDPRSRDAVFAEIMAFIKTPDGCDFSYAQYGRSGPLQ